MPTRNDRIRCYASIFLCLLCCGCLRPDGGDPEVWHDTSVEGSAEILSVIAAATPSDAQLTMQFTYEGGRIDQKPLGHVKLASIRDLPEEYQPQVGDTLRLNVDVHYKGKMSVGPPDLLHSKVDKRTFTCLEVVEADSGSVNELPPPIPVQADDSAPAIVDESTAGKSSGNLMAENRQSASGIKAHPDSKPELGEIDHLIWNTRGVDQIEFTIHPDAYTFKIHVSQFRNQRQSLDLVLLPKDGQAFDLVSSIFDKQYDMQQDAFAAIDAAGTSICITLVDKNDNQVEVTPVSPTGDLRPIYEFVSSTAIQETSPESPAPKPTNKFEIEEMRWVTNGGGQIDFTIAPVGDSFEIRLKSRKFGNQPLDLQLTSENGQAFQVVHAIFSKQRDLKHLDTIPPGALTGTWTTITLVTAADQRTEFKNISTSGDLHAIYEFVDDAARKANGEEPRPIPDYGTNE